MKSSDKMSKFVQIAKDIINIRRITEPNKAEDGDEPVHGFIENTLYPVFGGRSRNIWGIVMIPISIVMSVSLLVMEK